MSSYTFKGGKYAGRTMASIADRGFIQWVATNHSASAARAEAATLLTAPPAPATNLEQTLIAVYAPRCGAPVRTPWQTLYHRIELFCDGTVPGSLQSRPPTDHAVLTALIEEVAAAPDQSAKHIASIVVWMERAHREALYNDPSSRRCECAAPAVCSSDWN